MNDFECVYTLARNKKNKNTLKTLKEAKLLKIDTFKKGTDCLTAAGQFAFEGNKEAVKLLKKLGASRIYIAYGYALAGNYRNAHFIAKKYKRNHATEADLFKMNQLILKGFVTRKNFDLMNDFIKELENTGQPYDKEGLASILIQNKNLPLAMKILGYTYLSHINSLLAKDLALGGYNAEALDFIREHPEECVPVLLGFAEKGSLYALEQAIETLPSEMKSSVMTQYSGEIISAFSHNGHSDAAIKFNNYRIKHLTQDLNACKITSPQPDKNTQLAENIRQWKKKQNQIESENNHNNAFTFKKLILKKATESSHIP